MKPHFTQDLTNQYIISFSRFSVKVMREILHLIEFYVDLTIYCIEYDCLSKIKAIIQFTTIISLVNTSNNIKFKLKQSLYNKTKMNQDAELILLVKEKTNLPLNKVKFHLERIKISWSLSKDSAEFRYYGLDMFKFNDKPVLYYDNGSSNSNSKLILILILNPILILILILIANNNNNNDNNNNNNVVVNDNNINNNNNNDNNNNNNNDNNNNNNVT